MTLLNRPVSRAAQKDPLAVSSRRCSAKYCTKSIALLVRGYASQLCSFHLAISSYIGLISLDGRAAPIVRVFIKSRVFSRVRGEKRKDPLRVRRRVMARARKAAAAFLACLRVAAARSSHARSRRVATRRPACSSSPARARLQAGGRAGARQQPVQGGDQVCGRDAV